MQAYTGHGHDVRGVDVLSDNSKFVSCGGDKQVFVWDVARGSVIRRFKGHDGAVNDVRYAADEQARPRSRVSVSHALGQQSRLWYHQ